MRAAFIVMLVASLLLTATPASATLVQVQYKDYPADAGDPTVKTCVAYSHLGQKCRMCSPTFRPDGTVAGWTCVSVMDSQNFCSCGDMSTGGCYPKGLCTYQ
jgi:hypothetical protein